MTTTADSAAQVTHYENPADLAQTIARQASTQDTPQPADPAAVRALVRAWIEREQPHASAAELYDASQRIAAGGDMETARAVFYLADERAKAAREANPDAPQPKRPPPPQRRKGGRPAIHPHQVAATRSVRLNDERWAKLKALGMDWLAKQIDRAPDPA